MLFEALAGLMVLTAAAHFLCGWVFWKRSGLAIDYLGFMDLASPNRWSSTTPAALMPLFRHRDVALARNTVRALMLAMFVGIAVLLAA